MTDSLLRFFGRLQLDDISAEYCLDAAILFIDEKSKSLLCLLCNNNISLYQIPVLTQILLKFLCSLRNSYDITETVGIPQKHEAVLTIHAGILSFFLH